MKTSREPFRVSAGLKDLIGRGLITNDFVAIFELVKNSIDAHATRVNLAIQSNKIIVADNGKGMSRQDILAKWLFVAYSAKKEGTEDERYHPLGRQRERPFAGAKGVGRFSCDRLGRRLLLSSRSANEPVQTLEVDWTLFENSPSQEFGNILMNVSESEDFPQSIRGKIKTGTILEITDLRSEWDRSKLKTLKRELMKLIDPFDAGPTAFKIRILCPAERANDRTDNKPPQVNGSVDNPILDVLGLRTTMIEVVLRDDGREIESKLEDRGELIYRIREENRYRRLEAAEVRATIYFLNRSAKAVFARRMGIPSVQFGSIFLFRNGFRVFPVGHEHDDFFGLARRQQQGTRRFLGNRDVIGCVRISGSDGFEESTSRDHGLIRTSEVDELIRLVVEKCIRRLERYVVDITWKDKLDKDTGDTSRMMLDASSARVAQLVSRLSASADVELLDYSPNLVRILDDKSNEFETSLKALELLAERTGDSALNRGVREAKIRLRELEESEAKAREAERRAEERAQSAASAAAQATKNYHEERKRNEFLVAAASLDEDTVLNLHHQIIMHAADVRIGISRMMRKMRSTSDVREDHWVDFLDRVAFRNSQILTAARFATKGGYRKQSTEVDADLAGYIEDYIRMVSSLWAPRGILIECCGSGKPAERRFRPIEVGIVIDNLVSNAAKFGASRMVFETRSEKGRNPGLSVVVADDGRGWPSSISPISRIFEKGVTTTDGSGLGLFHVSEVVGRLGGEIRAETFEYSSEFRGAQMTMRFPG